MNEATCPERTTYPALIHQTDRKSAAHLRSSFALRNFSSKWATSSQRAAFSCGHSHSLLCLHDVETTAMSSSRKKSWLTNIMARAVLRSRRYLSRYFSLWFLRWPLFTLVLCSEELLVGGGKACAELPEPEPEMACCEGPRKDWAAKACRVCFRSSPVWEETERDGEKDDALIHRSARC